MWQSAMMRSPKRPSRAERLSGRRRARRTGVIALAWLFGTGAATLVLVREYHLDGAATLVAILGGLPGLYLAWETYRYGQVADEARTLAGVADELASAVRKQWRTEIGVRRRNNPTLCRSPGSRRMRR